MDLSMILSPDMGYDDDDNYNSNHHQYSPPQPQPSPPRPQPQQDHRRQQANGYSADEMRCAVAILQDFHQPEEDASAAAPASPPRRQLRQEQPPPSVSSTTSSSSFAVHRSGGRGRGRELVYEDEEEEQKTRAHGEEDEDDDDEDADEVMDDADADSTSHSDAAASGSGWASGSDLMSKLDLLVQADEMIQSSSSSADRQKPQTSKSTSQSRSLLPSTSEFVRSGVWTRAEEEYAAALIYYFLKGLLPLKEGTTLRKFLAEKLCCNRRRVSMKLATESIANKKIPRKVGASVFVAAHPTPSVEERDQVISTLDTLRTLCFDPIASPSLENRQRQSRLHEELPELLLNAPTIEDHHHQELQQPLFEFHQYYHRDESNNNSSQNSSPQKENREKQSKAASYNSFMRVTTTTTTTTSSKQDYATPKKKPFASSYRREPAPELLRSPPGTGNIKRRKPTIIRTGFETVEEERYVTVMFEYFMAGVLEIPEGTKLISFLCEQLECSPKTLSMKLAPRRLGERKFPDNVGSITYMRKDSKKNAFLYDPETVATRLAELRFACFDYENTTPNPPTQPKYSNHSNHHHNHSSHANNENLNSYNTTKSERKNSTASNSSSQASPSRLLFSRSGPWSREEEVYAAALIDCFFKGMLDIAEGTTLRAFLSSRLCCNPMRISKKLASEWIADIKIPKKLGSSTFVRRSSVTTKEHAETEESLRKLQHAYLHSETIKEGESSVGITGSKHSRQEEPEDDEDTESDARSSSSASASEAEEEEAAASSSSFDDIKSLSGKSPKKIRRVLADVSGNSKGRSSSVSVMTKPQPKIKREEVVRRKLGKRSPSPSSHYKERVAPMAY